jgi:uncharacterized protein (DUF1778 family)
MISKSKKRVTIAIDVKKIKEIKKRAIDADMSLSEFMVKSACEIDPRHFNGGGKNLS